MKNTILTSILFALLSISAQAKLVTVESVELGKFAGTWYQQAKNPIIFEIPCACAIQVLKPASEGRVEVINSCNKSVPTGELRQIRGYAKPTDSSNSKLSVDFGFPWKGDYWIIALDKDYRWAVVTDRLKYSLYILSKTPELPEDLYQEALKAASLQVSTKKLTKTVQRSCVYPQL